MNILDYLRRDFDSFESRPPCALDGLVLAQLAMVRLDGIVPALEGFGGDGPAGAAPSGVRPRDLLRAERFDDMVGGLVSAGSFRDLLLWMAASPRFRDLEVWGYASLLDPGRLMQFGAVSLTLPDRFTVVAFRGTDGTLVGWREDFSMAFMPQVAGQVEACRYLEAVAAVTTGPLYVTGHSKGGNLAAYATATCEEAVSGRIVRAFDLDGPGFREATVSSAQYDRAHGRIFKVVPQESVIGLLLDDRDDHHVVRSDQHGIMQHDGFSWQVRLAGPGRDADGRAGRGAVRAKAPQAAKKGLGDVDVLPDFDWAPHLAGSSELVRRIFADWMARYTDEELADFVAALFDALGSTGARTTRELSGTWQQTLSALAEIAKGLDAPQRQILLDALAQFASTAVQATASSVNDAVSDGISGRLGPLQQLRGHLAPGAAATRDGEGPAARGSDDAPAGTPTI